MKNAKKLVLAAVVLPLTLATTSAFAFGGGKGHDKGPHGECGMDRGMWRQLDLTDAQKTQLKEMRESGKEQMREKHKEQFAAHQAERQAMQEQVNQLVLADTFDQASANELAKQMVEKQTERKVRMLEKQHQMLSILTPEQKEQYVELKKERMTKCQDKMQKHFSK